MTLFLCIPQVTVQGSSQTFQDGFSMGGMSQVFYFVNIGNLSIRGHFHLIECFNRKTGFLG